MVPYILPNWPIPRRISVSALSPPGVTGYYLQANWRPSSRRQVTTAVWCFEPLNLSSLAVHASGTAGRAARTCSPFFTLILKEARLRVRAWTPEETSPKAETL